MANKVSPNCILMPIKPRNAGKIYDGIKLFEYRKLPIRRQDKPILLYETKPISKITGIIDSWDLIEDTPEMVWHCTRRLSGMTTDAFKKYYDGCTQAYAIRIRSVQKFRQPFPLSMVPSEANLDIRKQFTYINVNLKALKKLEVPAYTDSEYDLHYLNRDLPSISNNRTCQHCAYCVRRGSISDQLHRPEDSKTQYICIRRGHNNSFETAHSNTCNFWKREA